MEIDDYVEQYGDYLYRIAYVYTKDKQLAEEVVQDVFMKFYQAAHQFEGRAALKTYLTKITINCSYDHLRKWKTRTISFWEYLSKSNPTSESFVIEQQERDEIITALLTLPLKYREVIMLYYYDDLSVAEIAALIHIPASTVTTRLQRARTKLKAILPAQNWEVLRDA